MKNIARLMSLLIGSLFLFANASHALTVTNTPASCTNVTGIGTRAWTNPDQAFSSIDSYANIALGDSQTSNFLRCLNYGFAIPPDATIRGITVLVERKSSNVSTNSRSKDAAVRVVKGGTIGAVDRSTGTFYTESDVTEAHGGSVDLWGQTWTAADINSPNFGAAFAAIQTQAPGSSTRNVLVDLISIAVDYDIVANTAFSHIQIQHPSGTGLTCVASTLTVRACANTDCSKLYTGGVTGTLTATGTPTVNWNGATGGATGAGFVIPAGDSDVTKNLQVTTAGSVVFGVLSPTTPAATNAATCNFDSSPSCTFTASAAGFIFDVPHHVSEVSQTVNVSAVKTSDISQACVPAFSGAKNITFKCAYTNPASGALPVRVNGTALNAAGSAAGACDVSGKSVSLSFGSTGVASTTIQYADVGNISLTATYTGSGTEAGLIMLGSDSFIAAPKDFAFSAITAGPIKAGNNFSATVTARNNANATTANFGKETPPAQVTINRVRYKPTGGGTSDGLFSGSLGAFTGGAATASNLNWSEVGLIDLSATLTSSSYLGSGLSASGSTGTTGAVGSGGAVVRFIPDHFDTAVSLTTGVPMPCPTGLTCPAQYNGFVYSGQGVPLLITARNGLSPPTTTINYTYSATASESFSKAVTLRAVASVGGLDMATAAPGGEASAIDVPDSSFNLGSTPTTSLAYPVFTFAAKPTVPTDVYWRASDTDNVSSLRATSASSVEGGVKVASGRIRVPNAYGSERLGLPMTATVQYYNPSSHWATSTTDSASAFAFATPVIISGPLVLANLTSTVSADACLSSVVFCKGQKTMVWSSANVAGSADITVTAPTWLQHPWIGTTPTSPTARATFGIYKSPLIYRRENY